MKRHTSHIATVPCTEHVAVLLQDLPVLTCASLDVSYSGLGCIDMYVLHAQNRNQLRHPLIYYRGQSVMGLLVDLSIGAFYMYMCTCTCSLIYLALIILYVILPPCSVHVHVYIYT